MTTVIDVTLSGIVAAKFNKYANREEVPPEQKFYIGKGNVIGCPDENLFSFLAGDIFPGCAKSFEGRKSKGFIRAIYAYLAFSSEFIPLENEKGPIVFNGFNGDGTIYVDESAPVIGTGTKGVKDMIIKRPVLKIPWMLNFQITLFDNDTLKENRLHNWFDRGGLEIGLFNHRPRYGRFAVTDWNPQEKEKTNGEAEREQQE